MMVGDAFLPLEPMGVENVLYGVSGNRAFGESTTVGGRCHHFLLQEKPIEYLESSDDRVFQNPDLLEIFDVKWQVLWSTGHILICKVFQ